MFLFSVLLMEMFGSFCWQRWFRVTKQPVAKCNESLYAERESTHSWTTLTDDDDVGNAMAIFLGYVTAHETNILGCPGFVANLELHVLSQTPAIPGVNQQFLNFKQVCSGC